MGSLEDEMAFINFDGFSNSSMIFCLEEYKLVIKATSNSTGNSFSVGGDAGWDSAADCGTFGSKSDEGGVSGALSVLGGDSKGIDEGGCDNSVIWCCLEEWRDA